MTKTTHERFLRDFRHAYEVGVNPRGRPDQTTIDYKLSAPVTIDGEDIVADSAAQERIIVVNMSPLTIQEDSSHWQAFQELTFVPLNLFAGRYIQHTLAYDKERLQALWKDAYSISRSAFKGNLPDRIRKNITVCICGLLILHEHLVRFGVESPEPVPWFVNKVFRSTVGELMEEGLGGTLLYVDEMFTDLINAVALPRRWGREFMHRYFEEDNSLWIHLATARSWWYSKRRSEGLPVLDKGAIDAQIRERTVQAGEKAQIGQYLIPRRVVRMGKSTQQMIGIDLYQAYNSGLDIPERLDITTITIDMSAQEQNESTAR